MPESALVALISFGLGVLSTAIAGLFSLIKTYIDNKRASEKEKAEREEERQKIIRRDKADFYLEVLRPLREQRAKMAFYVHHVQPDYQEFQEAAGQAKALILSIPEPSLHALVEIEYDEGIVHTKMQQIDEAIKWLGKQVYSTLFNETET